MTDAWAVNVTDPVFQLPELVGDQMYARLTPVQASDLTSGVVGGTGVFDKLMTSVQAQLKGEFQANRITGGEYTKAYIAMVSAAMQTALQFVLGKDQAFWAAQQAQIAAIQSRLELEKGRYDYMAAQYNYDNILPLQLAGMTLENAGKTTQNAISAYNLATILPLQSAGMTLENTGKTTANSISAYNLATMLPAQLTMLTTQTTGESLKNTGQTTQNSISAYSLNTMLPAQLTMLTTQTAGEVLKNTGQDVQNQTLSYSLANMLPAQLTLVKEQGEVQHAQTSNTRLDGTTLVTGLVGAQESLYAQQVISYKRDAEVKAAKLFSDAWITQKTIDSGLVPPLGFTNDSVNEVLTVIMANNLFGTPTA